MLRYSLICIRYELNVRLITIFTQIIKPIIAVSLSSPEPNANVKFKMPAEEVSIRPSAKLSLTLKKFTLATLTALAINIYDKVVKIIIAPILVAPICDFSK